MGAEDGLRSMLLGTGASVVAKSATGRSERVTFDLLKSFTLTGGEGHFGWAGN